MADRRYGSQAWKRLRLEVLAAYGYVCQIQGPNCAGRATSVHHRIPSSERPDLFWSVENLTASCGPCNYAGGAYQTAEKRRKARAQTVDLQLENEHLQQTVELLEARVEELAVALVAARNGPTPEPARKRARPGIS